MKKNKSAVISFLLMTALVSCSSMPDRNARLDDARQSYRDAQSDPLVVDLAALELKEAGDALSKAVNASNQRQDAAAVDHLAYLAQQRVAIAQETAKRKGAEATVSQADAQRDKIRLAARTAEADKAQRNAEASQRNAEASQQQARDAEARARRLELQLNELNAKPTDRGLVITLGDVLFDTGRAQLKPGGVRQLQKLADALKQTPQRSVSIEGFTDSKGTESHNQELSERRADAVRSTLLEMGISSGRITTRGYGKNFPVAGNDSEAGRQLNRRVEIVISDETGNIRAR
jgi:outer membrane protein OmpA-like peptidoglycan-associated protein